MKRSWIIPLIVLILLALALAFRWDYNATKTYNDGVSKWKTDRWTRQGWIEVYSTNGVQGEAPTNAAAWAVADKPYIASCWAARKAWTTRWYAATGAALSWLFYAAWGGPWLRKKRKVKTEVEPPTTTVIAEVESPPMEREMLKTHICKREVAEKTEEQLRVDAEESTNEPSPSSQMTLDELLEQDPVNAGAEIESPSVIRKIVSYPLGLLVYVLAYFLSAAVMGISVSGRVFYSTLLVMAAAANITSFSVFRLIYPKGKSNKKVQTIFLIILFLMAITFFVLCFMGESANPSNLPMYSVFSIGYIAYLYHTIKKDIKGKEAITEEY